MDTLSYPSFACNHNTPHELREGMVKQTKTMILTAGQQALLSMVPEQGDIILLDDALSVVATTDDRAYVQIVTLMNRGALAAEFANLRSVDPEIVLRRL